MLSFAVQTMLLLTTAYFFGCMFGCFARMIDRAAPVLVTDAGTLVSVPQPPPRFRIPADLPPMMPEPLDAPLPRVARAPVDQGVSDRLRKTFEGTPTSAATVDVEPAPRPVPVVRQEMPRIVTPATPRAPIVRPEPAAPVLTVATGEAQDLKRIKGIGPEVERRLNALGVRRYDDIAGWSSSAIAAISTELNFSGRIQHENWIEQAKILALGGETAFSRRVDRREVAASPSDTWVPVAPQQVEQQGMVSAEIRGPAVTSVPARTPSIARPVVTVAPVTSPAPVRPAVVEPPPATVVRPAAVAGVPPQRRVATGPDDLKRVRGIGAEEERLLNRFGVTRFAQVARFTANDANRVGMELGDPGRVERERWIEQAQVLARQSIGAGGSPEVQSVRPAAAQPVSATIQPAATVSRAVPTDAPRPAAAATSGAAEDLKRIRGISVTIENRLNTLGINRYAQLADWTPADVARISGELEFAGRIERENWIEQARVLANGGQTDFSRRVDRGEVVSNRDPQV